MDLDGDGPQRRRRGAELEAALLEAAWAELAEHGYGALTFDAVAQRASTSRSVVYRRWATKPALAEAAITHVGRRDKARPPNTGSLREDMLAILRHTNEKRIGLMALTISFLGGYFQETGTTPYDLRRLVLHDGPTVLDVVVEQAVARGEIAATLPPRVVDVAFDLFRHEALMRLGPVPDAVLVEIVDEIFLPLATGSVRSDP
ncbi:TetR/AcrR family transcriptional regulator [Nocardioides sp. YIM 152315]|uniref:TetR/AcrR family transcriptional regulator n=1 Tax=Nocardioides sp. YIM 152315 TaxID=3031760 RepID=UPI0023D98C89|nr:TetR/AcrR family transcriptional regulator [Nocardioides sp. YIM 152315]MDF1602637.1 TetR/AcrR family transcriptional regulator [Nocardioides sp. YIM 152315]